MVDFVPILIGIVGVGALVVGIKIHLEVSNSFKRYGMDSSLLDLFKELFKPWDCPQTTQMQKPFSSYNNAYNEGYIHGMSVGQQFHHHRNNFPQ